MFDIRLATSSKQIAFRLRIWLLLLGAFLLFLPASADAQSRARTKPAHTTRTSGSGKVPQLKGPATPTPIGDTERTIYDLLYFPFTCLNAHMPTQEVARQEVLNAFGTCEIINGFPGLHAGEALDFTYRGVAIGTCYYDWFDNRTWYTFYFNFKNEADQFYNQLVNDIKGVGIPLTKDKIYGDMSNRTRPVFVFKWVCVDAPVMVKEADASNIETENVVGMYKVELGVMKKKP